jgi:hypothetical protein
MLNGLLLISTARHRLWINEAATIGLSPSQQVCIAPVGMSLPDHMWELSALFEKT